MRRKKFCIVSVLMCLLLCIALFCTACGTTDEGADENGGTENGTETKPFSMAVISDIHLLAQADVEDPNGAVFNNYASARLRMLDLGEAIFRTAIDQIIESGVDVLLVSGDLTENGSKQSFEVIRSELERAENAGITVCVTAGISDFKKLVNTFPSDGTEVQYKGAVKADKVPEILSAFGYGEALTRDESGTQSYVVDLPNSNYRLMMVDTASLYESLYLPYYTYDNEKANKTPPVSDELMEYMELNLMQAEEDEKDVIVLSYFPVNNSLGEYLDSISSSWSIVGIDRRKEVQELFKSYGVKYVFSGRLHSQKKIVSEDEDGTLVEYCTACLTNYPTPINYFTQSGDELVMTEQRIGAIKEEYLPDHVSEEVRRKVTTDLVAYGKEFSYENIDAKWHWSMQNNGTEENGLIRLLLKKASLYNTEGIDNAVGDQIAEDFTVAIEGLAYLPFYGEGDTLESACKKYGVDLPKTEHKNAIDLINNLLCRMYENKLELSGDSDEAILLRYLCYRFVEELSDLDVFGRLKEIKDTFSECDMQPIVDKLYEEDILDVTINDFIMCVVDMVNWHLECKNSVFHLNFKSSEDLLDLLATLFPIALSAIFNSNEFNPENNTLWGIPYMEYINVSAGQINMKRLFGDFLIDFIAKELIY